MLEWSKVVFWCRPQTTKSWAKLLQYLQPTKLSTGSCWMWYKVQVVMNGLPPIPYVLWVHGQGLKTLEHNQYTGMPSIRATAYPSWGTRFGSRICKTTMPSSWWCMLLYETTDYGCVGTHSTCLVGAWTRSDNPVTQSMHWDVIQPKPQSTQAVGPDLVGYAKSPYHHHGGMCCHLELQAIYMLPPIP